MKIIVDNKIPYIQKAIERIADEVEKTSLRNWSAMRMH